MTAQFNFRKESKLYVVYGGLQYQLDSYPDISFSQTFNETSVPVKTLHTQGNMFADAVITKANPANFNFTIPLLTQSDMKVIFNLLVDWDTSNVEKVLKTCDLYIAANTEVYKLTTAVFENGIFQIVKDRHLTLSLSGTASQLSKFTGTIPGTVQTRSAIRTYVQPSAVEITLAGLVLPYINSVTMEIQNNVSWIPYDTLQQSMNIGSNSAAGGTIFPAAFVVSSRQLSGKVVQYITDDQDSNVTSWNTAATFRLRVGTVGNYLLDFNIPEIVYTNAIDPGDIYTQAFDYRSTYNPANLSDIITYNTV